MLAAENTETVLGVFVLIKLEWGEVDIENAHGKNLC